MTVYMSSESSWACHLRCRWSLPTRSYPALSCLPRCPRIGTRLLLSALGMSAAVLLGIVVPFYSRMFVVLSNISYGYRLLFFSFVLGSLSFACSGPFLLLGTSLIRSPLLHHIPGWSASCFVVGLGVTDGHL